MPDFEYALFDALRSYVDGKTPGLSWSTVQEPKPAKLPAIFFEVKDFPVDSRHMYGALGQFFLPTIVIKVRVADYDKITAKQLLLQCDEYMASIGLIRSFGPSREDTADGFTMYTIYDENIVRSDGVIFKR